MQASFPRTLMLLLAGPIIWAAHFVIIYSVHGISCARPAWHGYWGGVSPASWIIVAASLLALAAMALIYRHLRTRMPFMGNPGFLSWLAGALSLLSAVAIIWETIPVLWLPACS